MHLRTLSYARAVRDVTRYFPQNIQLPHSIMSWDPFLVAVILWHFLQHRAPRRLFWKTSTRPIVLHPSRHVSARWSGPGCISRFYRWRRAGPTRCGPLRHQQPWTYHAQHSLLAGKLSFRRWHVPRGSGKCKVKGIVSSLSNLQPPSTPIIVGCLTRGRESCFVKLHSPVHNHKAMLNQR